MHERTFDIGDNGKEHGSYYNTLGLYRGSGYSVIILNLDLQQVCYFDSSLGLYYYLLTKAANES